MSKEKKPLHWAVQDVFDQVRTNKMSWDDFSAKILAKTGLEISKSTLRYWYCGYSSPKVEELDAMAAVFDLELELMKK